MLHAARRETQPAQMGETPTAGYASLSSLQESGRTAALLLAPTLGCSCQLSRHMLHSATSPISKTEQYRCTTMLASLFNGLAFHTIRYCYHSTAPSVFLLIYSKATHHLLTAIKAAKRERQKPHDWPQLQGSWLPSVHGLGPSSCWDILSLPRTDMVRQWQYQHHQDARCGGQNNSFVQW